jgi:hypothetical protein
VAGNIEQWDLLLRVAAEKAQRSAMTAQANDEHNSSLLDEIKAQLKRDLP